MENLQDIERPKGKLSSGVFTHIRTVHYKVPHIPGDRTLEPRLFIHTRVFAEKLSPQTED
jgi:hypothetical protein